MLTTNLISSSIAGMGRPRPGDSGVLDRGVPKPNKKKRRLSDGAPAGGGINGTAAVQKGKVAAATGSALSCPAVVTRALARAVETQQRTLCVLLSDAPDAGTISNG